MDIQARVQLFDFKTTYKFQTWPGFDQYNMPLYGIQTEGTQTPSSISYYPVYQGLVGPAYINGIQVPLQTEKQFFFNMYPNIVQQLNVVAVGNGGTNYTFNLPIGPSNQLNPLNTPLQYILRGNVDMTGLIASGNPPFGFVTGTTLNQNIPYTSIFPSFYVTTTLQDGTSQVVQDSGQFLTSDLSQGLLMYATSPTPGTVVTTPTTPYVIPSGGYASGLNTVNYLTGKVNVTFARAVPTGVNINAQCYLFQTGLPRTMLFYDNVITLRPPPSQQFLVEIDAYLSPASYLAGTNAVQFAYMSEYIARGAARKILSDTGDWEQFDRYEPLFRQQEMLVWKRSQRQFTETRTQSLYSQGINQGQSGFGNIGGSVI